MKSLPMLEPVTATPTASEVPFENQCGTIAEAGIKRMPNPTPRSTACARKNCQYCVQRLCSMMPVAEAKVPQTSRGNRWPESHSGPVSIVVM